MSALWGAVTTGMLRGYRAECKDCRWAGEIHFELDSEAVRFAAADSHAHNSANHPEMVIAELRAIA